MCNIDCTDGDVRLVNGTTSNEGRVEYCIYGYWNAICTNYDYLLNGHTAYNICNKLGYKFNSCEYYFLITACVSYVHVSNVYTK